MNVVIYIICLIVLLKTVCYFYNILLVKKNLEDEVDNKNVKIAGKKMLIMIPVLREQKVVVQTMEHFIRMKCEGVDLYIIAAGTKREKKIGNSLTTKEVYNNWLSDMSGNIPDNINCYYCEADDINGDRATQLNYAMEYFSQIHKEIKLDYVGVYDADSLPSENTMIEVVNNYLENKNLCACQQPVHFIKAANRMAKNGVNPILVANAMYQTTWTVIRELPSWIKYYKHNKKSPFHKNIYLIGHGEFISYKDYEAFKFPEYEITDGIQLGYRLSMSNKKIKPLFEFCDDDVPQSVKQLINQHKRWFGGCMNLKGAYDWSKDHFGTNALFQLMDGYWSQLCWAWASISVIICILYGLLFDNKITAVLIFLTFIYSYIIPFLAHKILPVKISVRMIDWLCIPIAIVIKGIGPNKFILEKLRKKKIVFEKVER